MAMLTNGLNKLIECLQLQVNCKTIAFSDIEHAASSLIINDEFDSLPKKDPLFGYKKGILNRGPHRIGYAKDKSNIVFRMGKPGSHNHRFSIKLPVKWRGYK